MVNRIVDVVLVRMDKLGDLVLSLPVDEHPVFAAQRVHWFITRGLGFVAEQAAPQRQCTEFPRGFTPLRLMRMYLWLRRNRPRTIVLLQNPWWVSLAAWAARVPERIGRKSQWHSFLFLNVGIRQKRSLAERHESDYNFELVEWAFNRLGHRRTFNLKGLMKTYLRLLAPNPFATTDARDLDVRGFRVVHPGMAGSALNWPQKCYVELIEKMARDLPVVITGTRADEKYLVDIKTVKDVPNVRWLVDDLRPSELLDLLSQARSVVAPSTGVLHLAASLGTPSIGLYSPRTVEHPRRWGPKGLYASYLVPPAQDVEMIDPGVMESISPDQVWRAVVELERSRADEAQPSI